MIEKKKSKIVWCARLRICCFLAACSSRLALHGISHQFTLLHLYLCVVVGDIRARLKSGIARTLVVLDVDGWNDHFDAENTLERWP